MPLFRCLVAFFVAIAVHSLSSLAPYVPLLPCRLSHGIKTCLLCGYLGSRVGLLTAIKLVDFSNEEHVRCLTMLLLVLNLCPFLNARLLFFVTILLVCILLYLPFGDMPTPSLTNKVCHDVARLWGWKWVHQDNQDMKAKAVMRWTCASCGQSKDVRFNNMKKFGPGKHKCSKQSQPQEKVANAKAKDGCPSVTTLQCHQIAARYGCDYRAGFTLSRSYTT